MNFYRNQAKLRGRSNGNGDHGKTDEHTVTLEPGEVHEASHWMPYKGSMILSDLTFVADPVTTEQESTSIQSFLDIVIFEVPEQCTSDSCDVSKYGVGKMDHFGNKSFVNMCEDGRLRIDSNVFRGFHTQLMVPSVGTMPRKVKHGQIALPHEAQTYKMVFANCNDNGRKVQMFGQAVLDYDENQVEMTFDAVVMLMGISFSICLLFSLLTIRIRRGTRAEYIEYRRLDTVEG